MFRISIVTSIFILLSVLNLSAQDRFANVEITSQKINDHLYMLQGSGGNIMISVGADGVLMIDDQFAPLSEKIMAKIKEISGEGVTYLINTHWHGDHTGGNENFGKAGATIIAQHSVRKRMARGKTKIEAGREIPPAPAVALPVITFGDDMKLHFNGDDIHLFHFHAGHTDGDGIIYFTKDNVVHMGDTFFNLRYPYIDLKSGGDVDGLIKTLDEVLFMVDDDTVIVPGHGELGDKADLQEYRSIIFELRNKVSMMIKQGKSLEEIQASGFSKEYDEAMGQNFINPERFAEILHSSLTKESME
jgi:glyoxylase-like metal-dependent hydrolase (beta-lactamase superfamily II)